jgi:hypothetical protein
MYAEGDSETAGTEQAQYLKTVLLQVVTLLKERGDVYMPLLQVVFKEQITRFYKTKSLTKHAKEDLDQHAEEDLDQDNEPEDDHFQTIDDIIGQPAQSSILQDLEDSDLSELSDLSDSESTPRQHFMYLRVKQMDDQQYQQFLNCRQTKLFSKGIQQALDSLKLHRHGELKTRKICEMFGYVLRTCL